MTEMMADVARASVLLDLKRYDDAVSLLARIVAAEPADSHAWCLLAAAHQGAGRHQESAAAARRATALAPTDDWPYRLASYAHIHLGNVTAALGAANEACKLAPHDWRAHVCLARAQLATEVDFIAAEQAAAHALRLAPFEPDAHYVAGLVSYAQEKWRAARAHQQRVLALDPTHSGALNELGRIRARRGNLALAAGYFIQATRSAPGVSAYARNVEAAIRLLIGRTLQAAGAVTFAALGLTQLTSVPRPAVGIGYAATLTVIALCGAMQLRRMPSAIRPLLRTRRMTLALSVVFGAVLVAIAAASATSTSASLLPAVLLAAIALIVASAVAARLILRAGIPRA